MNKTKISADETSTSSSSTQQQQQLNGLTRSRRSHFSRKDSTPEGCTAAAATGQIGRTLESSSMVAIGFCGGKDSTAAAPIVRIVHEYERLMYYAKSPHSWALPTNWIYICDKFPTIIRNKVNASTTTTTVHDNNSNNGFQQTNNADVIRNIVRTNSSS